MGAMPLNSDLVGTPPVVVGNVLTDNVIDLGENVYWLTRYNGYLYSNGEVIRYDASEFDITGTGKVWISSNQEYQKYFSSIPFNGKIYPTGLVRIYATPNYETVDGITRLQNGAVVDHGRAQFATQIVSHFAGINSYWTNNNNVRGLNMQSQYLFSTKLDADLASTVPATTVAAAGISNTVAKQSTRNSIIKNFMVSVILI